MVQTTIQVQRRKAPRTEATATKMTLAAFISAPDDPAVGDGAPPELAPEAPADAEAPALAEPDALTEPEATAEGGIPDPLGVGPEAAAAREKLAVMGPGTAVALAPIPERLGTGVPGVTVPLSAIAACWKAANVRLPEGTALIELSL